VDTDRPVVAELMASVAAAVSRRATTVSENVYEVTRREIPELGDDQAVLTLFASSIDSNVTTCLQIMQHQIDLAAVHAPAAALEEARRRAQRGTPLTALLRAYRLGHTVFLDWVFRELARQSHGDARMLTAVTMELSKIVAGYVDQTSEEIVATYARERENWLRNRSAAQAARIRDLLSGQLVNVSATEATLGYRLRQHHVGVVCWTGAEAASAENITRLDRAINHIAAQTAAGADPVFLPRDESSAWAWLPLGIRDRFDAAAASTADLDGDLHVAFGDVVKGIAGFRLTHQQALAAQAVALSGGSPPRVVTYAEVAPVAMMLGSADLLRAWVPHTLGRLATDDEHHDRLRHTLLVFLDTGGSYKATAERLVLHKNTVQYRIRKAEESLGHPVGDNRHDVELALQASRWLGSSVLQPAAGRDLPGPCVEGCCVTTALPQPQLLHWHFVPFLLRRVGRRANMSLCGCLARSRGAPNFECALQRSSTVA
jgi:DNA-binding PucR family transcriptional regulator